MNTFLVITGLIKEEYIQYLISSYKDVNHKIISTWYNQDKKLIKYLEDNNFIIVLDDYPLNNTSTNYQCRAIHNGCLKAKELGANYIIRMRTDVSSYNTISFINLLEEEFFPKDKLISFCGLETNDGIYFYDLMVAGKVNQMIDFYKHYQYFGDNRYNEKFLIESSINKSISSREDIRQLLNFCGSRCRDKNIHFYFNKYRYDVINDYCNRYYSWT